MCLKQQLCSCTVLILIRRWVFKSAGVVTEVSLTTPQAQDWRYSTWQTLKNGTDWEVAEPRAVLLLPPCLLSQLGRDRELGRARKAESFSPHSQQCKCLKTQTICRNKERQRQERFWSPVIRVRTIVTWNKCKYSYEVKYKYQSFLLTYPILVHAKATVIVVSYLPSWHGSFYILGVAGLQRSDQIHYGHRWRENYKVATKLT